MNMIPKEYMVPKNHDIIFVSDMFVEEYTGGAELTMEALIEASPFRIFKMHSSSVTPKLVAENTDKYWVLVNFTQTSHEGLIEIANTCKFSIIECDYKYCVYRSPQLHNIKDNKDCPCKDQPLGKFVKGLMKRAQSVHFMSHTHKQTYVDLFPEMSTWTNLHVQISTWTPEHLDKLATLRKARNEIGEKWAVLGGGSWIKDQTRTEQFCKDNNLDYEVIGGLPYDKFIEKLATYHGLVFMPAGYDTCPRLVIEAKLLGLKITVNDYVQHAEEDWFTQEVIELEKFLQGRPKHFWDTIDFSV